MPPPPPNGPAARSFSNAYGLHNSAVGTVAQHGIAPVNQMSNGFGGRQGGNPMLSSQPSLSSGNRTQQHVATPGNNNVSYGSPSLLNSSQSLWQQAQSAQGQAPVNGMSLGFMKNTQARPKTLPAPPPPTMSPGQQQTAQATQQQTATANAKTAQQAADDAAAAQRAAQQAANNNAAAGGSPVGVTAPPKAGTPAPTKVTMTLQQAVSSFESMYPKTARTYIAPDGSIKRTAAWQNYLNTINLK